MTRRSPHGERGLKLQPGHAAPAVLLSLPARGAWVEIHPGPVLGGPYCRSPHGERGLKFVLVVRRLAALVVAPRTGSVG